MITGLKYTRNLIAVKATNISDSFGSPKVIEDSKKIIHKRYQYVSLPGESIKVPVSYLINRTDSSDLVIFCHGFLSSEAVWNQPDFFSTDKWLDVRMKLKQEPNCISISFGMSWLLHNGDRYIYPRHLTTKNFFHVLDGLIEQYGMQGKRKLLVGSSMGGFNAFKLFIEKLGTTYFDRALFHVPMTPEGDPYSFNFMDPNFWKMLSAPIIRGHFTKDEWLEENPHNQSAMNQGPSIPIQIQISKKDEFNLYEGGKQLANSLLSRGHQVGLIINEGKHKDLNVYAASDFLKNNS